MILSKDLMEMAQISLRNQFAICQFKETDKKIEIELAAPGLKKKEDFKIELQQNLFLQKRTRKKRKEITILLSKRV
jgi:HSP20 family protein